MAMNSKKNKKIVNNSGMEEDVSNILPKKSKRKKPEVANENTNLENKSKKRKLVTIESDPIPTKKSKKKCKSDASLENNTELPATDDIENNVPSNKTSKRKNNIDKPIISEENVHFNTVAQSEILTKTAQPLKKSKKKKKYNKQQELENEVENNTELNNADPGEGVSSPKNIKNPKNSNQLVSVENSKELLNSSKKLIHEVNIIDIKEENPNEKNENVVTISIRDIEGMDSDWDENDLLKQLERKIDKGAKEKRVTINWPDSDLLELVERMQVGLPENDLKPFLKRSEELEWDKIAFKSYSIDDCKKTWSLVLKKIRKYRLLKEVLHDAKQWIVAPKLIKKSTKIQKHPDKPRRPLSAYFIYYLKKKDALQAENPGIDAAELAKLCSQKFKLLPPEKMMKYENIAKKNREEYDQKMKEFYEIHPELKVEKEAKSKRVSKPPKLPKPVKEKPPPKTPKPPKEKVPKRPLSAFQYYQLAELTKQPDEDKVALKELCREKWKEMPDDKKIEWISYAENESVKFEEEMKEYMKNHPDYENNIQKPVLTKEELLVKERMSGKPRKPPVSAYNLFARLMLHSSDIKNVPVKDRLVFVSNQWKECTDEEKKHYKELFDKTIAKYDQDLATYLESLPEAERKLELLKIQPRRRKSEDENVKKKLRGKKSAKKKVEPKLERKKNKVMEKKTQKLMEPEQPPISPFKYFATLYKGEEPAAKAWKALSGEEKERYEQDLVKKKKAYILDFEKFLKSMTKEELENFSNSRKKLNNQKAIEEDDEDDEDETSDQTESDDNSEDDSVDDDN